MDGLVFAAGEGTRLRPLTDDTPKPLLTVGGRPILTHCLDTLVDLGVDRLVIVVGYRGNAIVDRYGDEFREHPIVYARQEDRLGMAHALLAAESHVDADLAMLDGDCLIDADLRPLVDRHHDPAVDGTLLLRRVSGAAARTKAICEVGADGRLLDIVNRPDDPPRSALVAGGFQTATPDLVEACRSVEQSPRGEYELAAAIAHLIDQGRTIVGVEVDGWQRNVNTEADLDAARSYYG